MLSFRKWLTAFPDATNANVLFWRAEVFDRADKEMYENKQKLKVGNP